MFFLIKKKTNCFLFIYLTYIHVVIIVYLMCSGVKRKFLQLNGLSQYYIFFTILQFHKTWFIYRTRKVETKIWKKISYVGTSVTKLIISVNFRHSSKNYIICSFKVSLSYSIRCESTISKLCIDNNSLKQVFLALFPYK